MSKYPKKTSEIFATNFLKYRKRLNLKASELADKVGVTRASISRYESIDGDKFAFPQADTMDRIAEALEIKVSDLFSTDEKKSDPAKVSLEDAVFLLNRHLADAGLKISRLKKDA